MTPMFSIITPTLSRESLVQCCESVNNQTLKNGWEHIVQVDSADLNTALMRRIEHPQRHIYCCGVHHNNFGNTCRHIAWEMASGEWQYVLDDDNYLADDRVLEDLSKIRWNLMVPEQFAIFPILRFGSRFFHDPPGLCMTDTANVLVRREVGRWPDIPEYTADGIWIEKLKAEYNYRAFPEFRPIVVMEKQGKGE